MTTAHAGTMWDRLAAYRKQRRFQNILTLSLVVLGPVLAGLTFFIIGGLGLGASSGWLRIVLLADLVYVLVIAALVLRRVVRMIAARRARSAGSELHFRLTGVFAVIALVPTILVAVFATLTVNFGLEGWFSERVRGVVGNSLAAAQAYQGEHRGEIARDARLVADFLARAKLEAPFITDSELRQLVNHESFRTQTNLAKVFVIDSAGGLRVRGERSYLFDYTAPGDDEIARALAGDVVLIESRDYDEIRALVALEGYLDRLLLVSRSVDGEILNLLDETRETVTLYQQLESERGRLLFEFGLIYLGFAVILILAAVWLGLWFAERLSRPVGRLAGAAERVGQGDLNVQVAEEEGGDEIAMLGRVFNQMTRQLHGQREALLASHSQTEARRRLFDSVLGSVTSGVIGLDASGRIDFMNRAAVSLLDLDAERDHGLDLRAAVPEVAALLDERAARGTEVIQQEVRLTRRGKQETLLVRLATRRSEEAGLEGFVIAFDDVTDLVMAQRMAAWGDVARRIAHEIKNPLTPIQLSAERLRRKFSPQVSEEDREALNQYTDVIVRQTNDLRRIVNEFSRFARMPEPERRQADLAACLREAVMLERERREDLAISLDLPDEPVMCDIDTGMINQSLTNLLKNAGEATETYIEKNGAEGYAPQVRVTLEVAGSEAEIRIIDNGAGLPEDRSRLFEPYMTTRAEGTGLGLPIVKKIVEEHGGRLDLLDAPVFEGSDHAGAMAVMRLPVAAAAAARGAKAVEAAQ